MQSGLINKVAITPANVSDAKAIKHILPKQGAIFGDKGYCTKDSTTQMKIKNLHNCTIKTNNMKDKNFDKDKWISKARSPYERVFSKVSNTPYIQLYQPPDCFLCGQYFLQVQKNR